MKPQINNSLRQFTRSRLMFIVLCLLISFAGGWLGARYYSEHGTSSSIRYVSSESQLISRIAKEVGQSVVSVDTSTKIVTSDFFGFSQVSRQKAAGTGFVVDASGVIITNRHVVPVGTETVNVTLADGTRFNDVEILGRTSPSSPLDVAFLKINNLKGYKLTTVELGDSAKVEVGDKVIAIGNALGQFQNTVTAGIISGYGREITAGSPSSQTSETLTDLFQTDAAINEGNSGGPLVDVNGEIIGINTAIAGGAQNIGFAIPINDVKGLVAGVLKNGQLAQPFLGVHYVSLTDDIAYQYGLDVKRGAFILPTTANSQDSIVPGSPAAKVDLRERDVITKVDDINIDDRTSLAAALARFQSGDEVRLTVVRDTQTITIKVTLGTVPTR
ncbi:trypsin-like peptidase domain-containing protein [Candidatus Saccharibacteria bacterium]|nr:trypsin-like peptidase domain-containing protein [Candidatus Saccharibacteria bacterium]